MKSEEYNRAFTSVAPYYDVLMSFVNYPSWISYIERIFQLNNIAEKTILDLACGTGVCIELWLRRGYRLIGLDRSMAMLETARAKFSDKLDTDVCLINGDMCHFSFRKKIPIVSCLYDSLNYLLTEEDLLKCFKNVYEVLDSRGIFVFDMNTIHCLRDEWGNGTFQRQDEDVYSVWSNSFDPRTNLSSLKITLTIQKNGRVSTIKEFHQERGYSLVTIANLLNEAGFDFSLYKHLTFNPAHERDMRIMGIAKK